MNLTVSTIGQQSAAMDSRLNSNIASAQQPLFTADREVTIPRQDSEQDVKANVKQLQDIADIMGRKLRFNVNSELGKVIVKVIDPSTDKVIKDIPSAEIQQLQLIIKEVLGLLIDEKI